ncbi:putative GH family 25 lysozyme 4 [Toxocara canis]|uniref:Putative GH family 25 lysozyme 4 n=2 Tax=Toxocara canis TaxID=6265 RepID=A0A0B2VLJ7_TOXCA|nr:putative GH family 25 lysozyme 4 [Toxocara canis]VDM41212.1 unnamed protein product [Toxocara canis]
MRLLVIVCLVGVSHLAFATTGFDAIQSMSTSTFQCLYNNGYRFFIGRVWKSYGNYDYTGIQNIKNARAAGWKYVDGYIFPCLKSTCAPAANQVEATINKLRALGAQVGMLWMDIERFAWPKDQNHNRQFIRDMVNKAKSMGVSVGIYTNYYNWQEIVGLSWTEMSRYPLWWAYYDGIQNYRNFKPFGGWTKPAIHQYRGDWNGPCGVNMDLNWY